MPKIKPRIDEKHLFNFHKSFLAQASRVRNLLVVSVLATIVSVFVRNDYGYFVTFGLLLCGVIYALYIFWVWFQNVGIVTNQRLILVEKSSFFHQKVTEFDALQIRNVAYEIKGIFNTIFHTGKIILELNGDEVFEIKDVYGPEEVHDSIRALVRAHRY